MAPCFLVALLVSSLVQGIQPPREVLPPHTGTAIIRGRVVAADTSAPLREVLVTLVTIKAGPVASVSTDDEGKFSFSQLAAGRYQLRADPGRHRGQYLPARYGGEEANAQIVATAEGQTIDADIQLPRAAAIGGRITDESGEPLAHIKVSLVPDGGTAVESDDRGMFRVYGVEAGEYLVLAAPQPGFLELRENTNAFRPTYYPGARNKADAVSIHVGGGEEATADIRLSRLRLFRAAGRVTDSAGSALHDTSLIVLLRDSEEPAIIQTLAAQSDGRFVLRELGPGDYRLAARGSRKAVGGEVEEFGAVDFTIERYDIDGITLSTAPGITIAGRVIFEDGPAPKARGNVEAEAGDHPWPLSAAASAALQPDWTFTLADLWGTYKVRLPDIPDGWFLKAVMLGMTDITDLPTEFRAADSGRLQIELTVHGATLDFTATRGSGAAAEDFIVVLGPADRANWSSSRDTFVVRPGPDGHVIVKGVRPGRYLALAAPPDHLIKAMRKRSADALWELATTVTVAGDERRSVPLKLVDTQ